MSSRELFPIINCADLLSARAFYQEVFSARQVYQFPETGDPVYLTLEIGDSKLALGGGTEHALYGELPLPATGHAIDLCVYVADLRPTLVRALEAGGTVPVQPQDMPWGETVAYVRAPEGTMLLVIQAEAGTELPAAE